MRVLRRHRAVFGAFAGAAIGLHVFAGSLCPQMRSHNAGSAYFDAALGWIMLCVAARSADSAFKTSPAEVPSQLPSKAPQHSICAALCAAVVSAIAVIAAVLLVFLRLPDRGLRLRLPQRLAAPRDLLWGSTGNRGPPLQA